MTDAITTRPGLVRGVYPQRRPTDPGWLERTASALGGSARRHWQVGEAQARRVIERVNACSADLSGADERELGRQIALLRGKLARVGFAEEVVASTFALVREFVDRSLGMRLHDAQIAAGWHMLKGRVVELETGAGKTLTATLPACAAALAGIPVHVVTVNDYLVTRDATWTRPVYEALGLDVGTIIESMSTEMRQQSYRCAVTYTSNKQLVFDYLRDRLTFARLESPLQIHLERLHGLESRVDRLLLRGLCFAIVDEADSVLIDESRTPLIISRQAAGADEAVTYGQALALAARLELGKDFVMVPRTRTVELSPRGEARVRDLAQPLGGVWCAHRRSLDLVVQALNAHHLYLRDKHYLVKDGKVQIVDEFTGRTLADRSWERGLHQMLEVKEGCEISSQKETLSRISYQQFFRRYLHLAGMTGTAREVARELWSVYRLQVIVVASPWPSKRKPLRSRIYRTRDEKWQALVARIKQLHRSGQPVLIGTRSVAMSEHVSRMLHLEGVAHRVLNARQDQGEADVIKAAGEGGSIVVATNMAGRGTDIKLGPGVAQLGGLHVIATEIHEAGRIDRQLFGRCARQGDPGSFEMILSLEDDLVDEYCPMPLKPVLAGLKRVRYGRRGRLAWHVIRSAQRAAEREHARQRCALLKLDDKLQEMLAFSGSLG